MFEQKPPSVPYLSVLQCHFHDGQICDFSTQPRPFYIFSIIECGQATFQGCSGTVALQPGDVFFIPMGETYVSDWHGQGMLGCTSLFFTFEPDRNPLMGRQYPLQKVARDAADCKKLLGDISRQDKERDFFSFETLSAFYALCNMVFKSLVYQENSVDFSAIKPALAYLEKYDNADVSIKELAHLCHLSESRFYHVFKNLIGVSPVKYKNNRAIARAQLYLQCNNRFTIEEISEKCGFSSAIYFRKVFKQRTGKSPSKYKKQTLL